ncbi:polysaccharide deacetylase family protein [Alicyclobacillus sp. TC]|uniref:Peptidoglycan/xylan/chitin deacetylase, PgdA/CDA1 family n=1 Tax=Alicyclobacillus tolerans TaxID=90970 RepID=A0A1M6JPU7_9BACL|nr:MULTISPECIES: polysaccharide deacetylase family protein [Alicyclobacillus]QRF23159.1 polysaccharide deacetylase family protein [Alicyclobacillus sp. TC]SHJ48682.1 Peptidoglycan/xylan/chitin deacetylase, PgdA/CDA1 family [Alicyclobacillus montanus]
MIGWLILGLILLFLFLYSVMPNLMTRVWKIGCIYRGFAEPVVYLTFDDGPHPEYTPQLLDILREKHVRATFFVIAEAADRYPDIIRRMVSEGHDVEVHGDRHWFVPLLPPSLANRQWRGASQKLQRKFSLQTSFYRPTWGLCNLASFVSIRKSHHKLVTWSIMVGDWRKTPAQTLVERVVSRLHKGAIIVLHDNDITFGAELGAPVSVLEAIPKIIEQTEDKGYQFRPMRSLLKEEGKPLSLL